MHQNGDCKLQNLLSDAIPAVTVAKEKLSLAMAATRVRPNTVGDKTGCKSKNAATEGLFYCKMTRILRKACNLPHEMIGQLSDVTGVERQCEGMSDISTLCSSKTLTKPDECL
jgi:hypothetical protein